jgi:aspartate/methionine/tyrosine aminotransferase
MQLKPFRIEQYYGKHEFTAQYMLSSSDCESRTIGELLALEPDAEERLLAQRCGYTESPGAPGLREAISAGYQGLVPDDVLVASSAEEAIFVAYHALLRPGDHAIVETPCYESALELARSTGAEVSCWVRGFEDRWAHDLDALKRLLRPKTKLLYINTPHNPTGTHMPRAVFDHVVELARERRLVLFSDEVYRELEHDPATRLPGACQVYERAVSLGSISKSYGLPGLRIGWLASRDRRLLQAVLELKYYTTICSSGPSEFLTALALRNRRPLLERNLGIVRRNLPLLASFIEERSDLFEWVPPTASPIGFPRLRPEVDTQSFCEEVVAATGVLLLPGTVYDEPRHIRMGFGRENMPVALERLRAYLRQRRFS